MNLCDALFEIARANPGHPALLEDEQSLSYDELAALISQWGSALSVTGLKQGDRVGICLKDTSNFVLAMLGAAHRGVTFVPLDWRTPAADLAQLASDFETRLVLREPGTADLDGVQCVQIDADWHKRVSSQPADLKPLNPGDTPLFLGLSSGTTGKSKGAILTHLDLQRRMERSVESIGDYRGYRYLSILPLCFGGGNGFLLYHLLLGNTVVLYPPMFETAELLQAVEDYEIDFLFLVPTVLRWLLELEATEPCLLPGVRVLLTGTAPMSKTEKLAVTERICPRLWEFYSTTATGRIASLGPDELDSHAHSVGRPSALLETEIVDEQGKALPPGEHGYVRCRGEGVAAAYFGNPDQTHFSEKLIDGWCFTGDMGYFDEQGYLCIDGRADDLINRGGEKIQPGLIEKELLLHDGIREAAVRGRPNPALGAEPIAYVVGTENLNEEEILVFCKSRLRPSHVPVEIRLLPALPKTAAGKIQKHKLPD